MKIKKYESNESMVKAGSQTVAIKDITSMVGKGTPGYFSVAKEFIDVFKYRGIMGYKAFLAWALDTGKYFQGDLAVWHMAGIRRFVENGGYNRRVLYVIQNTEYAIIIAENFSNLLIEFFKIRIEDLENELDKDDQSTPKVGVSL